MLTSVYTQLDIRLRESALNESQHDDYDTVSATQPDFYHRGLYDYLVLTHLLTLQDEH